MEIRLDENSGSHISECHIPLGGSLNVDCQLPIFRDSESAGLGWDQQCDHCENTNYPDNQPGVRNTVEVYLGG